MTPRPDRRRRAGAVAATALCVVATLLVSTGHAADAAPKKGGHQGKVRFAATEIVSGAGVVSVTGKVPGGKRKVQLQVQTKGAWLTLKSTKSKRSGAFSVAAPLNWYGGHKVRITTTGRRPFTKAKKITVTTSYAPFGSAKSGRLLRRTTARTPRFNPCQTLTYKINAAAVPPNAVTEIQQAMAQISAASGIRMKYTGATTYVPFATRQAPGGKTDLVIAWVPEATTSALAGDVVGRGGELSAVYARDSAGRRAIMTTIAGVTLEAESYTGIFQEATEGPADRPPVQRLILHEVGHALGLAHSPSSTEVMYYTRWSPEPDGLVHARYGAGDLAGLKKLGLAQGCVTPIKRRGRVLAAPVAAPQS